MEFHLSVLHKGDKICKFNKDKTSSEIKRGKVINDVYSLAY